MADLRIVGGTALPAQTEYAEVEERLGLAEEATSLPEWQGWDRVENLSLQQSAFVAFEAGADLGTVLEQIKAEPAYRNLADLDEKRLVLDVLFGISTKIDKLVESRPTDRMLNLQETMNDLLDLYQTAYVQQTANIKG